MKSAINLVTPGEIKLGMYVMALGEKQYDYQTREGGEVVTRTYCPNYSPWFKGIPVQVVGIAGPILAIKTVPQPPNLPPVSFFDTRLVELAEIPKRYYNAYFSNMTGATPRKTPTVSQLNFNPFTQ